MTDITQADREAAADNWLTRIESALGERQSWMKDVVADILAGVCDDTPEAQAFACHREQSIAPYREALEEARAYVANNHDKGCELDPDFSKKWCGSGRWTKICTCGTAELLARIDTTL